MPSICCSTWPPLSSHFHSHIEHSLILSPSKPGLHRWHAPAHSTGFPSVGPLPLPPPPPRSSLSAGKKAEAQEARHADPLLVHIRQKVGDAAGHSRDEVALLRILCM